MKLLIAITTILLIGLASAELSESNFNTEMINALNYNAYLRTQLNMELRIVTEQNFLIQSMNAYIENPYLESLLNPTTLTHHSGGSSGGSSISIPERNEPKLVHDYNGDGLVDSQDLGIFKEKFQNLKDDFGTSGDENSDLNQDGLVDGQDFGLMKEDYNQLTQEFGNSEVESQVKI